jgi:hypothetical protein
VRARRRLDGTGLPFPLRTAGIVDVLAPIGRSPERGLAMTKISAGVVIHVSVESVGAFLDDWHGFPQWNLGVCDLKPTTEPTTGEGARYAWRERTLGREVEYEEEAYDWMPNGGSTWRTVNGSSGCPWNRLLDCSPPVGRARQLTGSGSSCTMRVSADPHPGPGHPT